MLKTFSKTQLINAVFLLGIPLAYIIIYVISSHQKGPYYWTPNQDPDYAYLMDSLNLVNLTSPEMYQHPGTTMQTLGAVVIAVSYWVQSLFNSNIAPLNDTVLGNPELYLELTNYTLITITGSCLLLLGVITYKLSHNIFLSLILQTTPLVMAMSLIRNEPSRVAPEALLFCSSQLLVVFLVLYLFKPTVERSLWFSIGLGMVLGIGLASKFTFLPLFLFLAIVPGVRQKLITIGAATITFFLATLPIFDKYLTIWNWLISLALNSEPYGKGEARVFSLNTVFKNLGRIIKAESLLMEFTAILVIGCVLVVLFSHYGKGSFKTDIQNVHTKRLLFLSALTAIAVVCQMCLTAIEYYQSRYLIPSIALIGFIIFLIVQLYLPILLPLGQSLLDRSNLTNSGMVIALALVIVLGIQQVHAASELIIERSEVFQADLAKIQTLLTAPEYSSCTLTLSRRASTIPSGLKFAEFWAGKNYGNVLSRLYPQALFFNEDNKRYEDYVQRLEFGDISQQGQQCVLFQTNPLRGRRLAKYGPTRPIEAVFDGKAEALYRIIPD